MAQCDTILPVKVPGLASTATILTDDGASTVMVRCCTPDDTEIMGLVEREVISITIGNPFEGFWIEEEWPDDAGEFWDRLRADNPWPR